MSNKRSTPLDQFDFNNHNCTVDLRLKKLGMVPFFQALSDAELQEVNNKFSVNHFSKGDTIYYQDEKSTRLRVLVYGRIKLMRHTFDGKDILLDILQPGEFFGSLSELGEDIYKEKAQAQTDTCVMSIGSNEFRSILKDHPSVAMAVLDITTNKLQSSQDIVHQLTSLPVEKRIVNVLLTLCNKFGEESPYGMLLQLPLSRKDLADMVGTSTETASRIMSRLQDEGFIKSGRQWVAIMDPDRLKKLAEK